MGPAAATGRCSCSRAPGRGGRATRASPVPEAGPPRRETRPARPCRRPGARRPSTAASVSPVAARWRRRRGSSAPPPEAARARRVRSASSQRCASGKAVPPRPPGWRAPLWIAAPRIAVWSARLGAGAVTGAGPRSVWPGAGAGSARDIPARGHDLLTDGRIVGPLFGRRIAYSGLETVRWLPVAPLDVGLAAFLDLAASGARPAGIDGRAFHSDVGLGVRLGLPGEGTLRLDVGRGLVDGAMAVSAGLARGGGSTR